MPKTSSNYISFARKYRPADFSQLRGQEVLVKTLTYCIENDRLAQAHLLTGIRGVGKTSSARIVAKTVNCTDLQKKDGQISPCNKCENCKGFNNHNHPDIIEIDAASKTSVDDIREIIESSEYRPLLGKMKFFIIDEIHMLSKSAFNALLKIVEEPPAHVVFIFATTEVQKIPLTVISRCQRYDLRRLSFDEIYDLVKNIAEQEKIAFEEEALKIIATKSEGSARDATAMLDQAASYVHNASEHDKITAELVGSMLGLLGASTILKFTQLIIANDPLKAIALLEEIYEKANSLEYFVQAMSDFMAELSKSKLINNYHNPLYQNYSKEISNILIGTSLSRLSVLWQIFSGGVREIRSSHNEFITAQMLLIKAIYACNMPSMEEIMDASELDSEAAPVEEKNAPVKEQVASEKQEADEKFLGGIFEFLKYCHANSEMEIYYLLLNEVEVQNFENNQLIVAGNLKPDSSSRIKELLKSWSNQDWEVKSIKQEDVLSLKEKMLEKVKQSGDYQVIKNYFPNANISDILLNI